MGPWNLLHLISSDRWTGAATPATHLVKGLEKRGHRVHLGLIRGKSFERHAREEGIAVVDSLHLHRGFNPLRDIADIRALARLVRAERIDLIHCHMNKDHWLAGVTRTLARLPVKIVRTQHRFGERPRVGAKIMWSRFTDAAVVLADAQRSAALPDARVHLIPGSVDTDLHHPDVSGAAVRDALGIPAGAPVVGMIAHFKAGRGWRIAIPAFAQVHRRVPQAHFLLAGGHSRLVKWVRAEMQRAGCLAQTHIISDRRFAWPEVIAAMDLSLWLGLGSEASARAALEVMATGRPVIAAPIGPIPEIITDAESGVILPAGAAPETLAKSITHLITDPEPRLMLGRAARAVIEARFTPARQLDQTEALYRTLLG